jgi:capsular polysaccharide transport system permease protein
MSSSKNEASVKDKTDQKGEVVTLPSGKSKAVTKPAQGNSSLVHRLKKSGLDPQKLLDLALTGTASKSATKTRHMMMVLGFALFVAIPSAAFSAYMFFWASDQYHSTAAFAVRSSNPVAATEVLGMVLDGGGESTTSNSYIVTDYLQSQTIVEDLSKDLDLQEIFNRESSDFLFSMGRDIPIEDQLEYWNGMVDASYDSTSGVIYLEVRSFRPEDSVKIAEAVLQKAEVLVNNLSEENRHQIVRFAQEGVARAEARLKAIRKQMLAYREESQEVSPEDNAKLTAEMIAGLDQERASREAEKATLTSYLDEDSPKIRMLNRQISALESEIASMRQRLGSGVSPSAGSASADSNALSFRIANYSELKLEEEFARGLYVSTLAGLEKAREDADSKSMYLATFIEPTLSQEAQYPHRMLYSLAVFLLLTGFWTVAVLLYYNVRDRT